MDNEIRGRKIIRKRRVDPESIVDLEGHVASLKEAITDGETIVNNLRGNPGWEKLQADWQRQLEAVEDQLNDFQNMTDKGRDFCLKERQDIKHVIAMVDKVEIRTIQYKKELSEALSKLRERKERVGTAQV